MPELPEVEAYRQVAIRALGRRITAVDAPDPWYLKGTSAENITLALTGRRFTAARRVGKLLLLDTDRATLGLRFGMTGRLFVDGVPGVDALLYSSNADNPGWDRFSLHLGARGRLVMRDPRRLGGVELDPDVDRLGPDARTISSAALRAALQGRAAPLKACLLDQARVAGIGNLIADEALWRCGLDPGRPAGSLTPRDVGRLARAVRDTVELLIARGGSHCGDFLPHRAPGGRCPRDGEVVVRRTIAGRTTWSCPRHQV